MRVPCVHRPSGAVFPSTIRPLAQFPIHGTVAGARRVSRLRFDESGAKSADASISNASQHDEALDGQDCCNVLVVDDQPANLQLVEACLVDLGLHVITAQSGAEALEKAQHRDLVLVLMDIRMPGMSGIDAAIQLRKQSRHATTPIIFVTAYTPEDQEILGGFQTGAADYLFKPLVPQVLRAKVAAFAEQYRSNCEARRQAAREASRQQLEEDKAQLEIMAHYDALTGLANRKLLMERLGQALDGAKRDGKRLAVLFVDLDDFKQINDSLGHHAGDAVLHVVAARLRHCVRKDDTVARLGGDEFVIVLQGVETHRCAIAVAEKGIGSLAQPFHVNGTDLLVAASMGVSVFPEDGADVETLLKNADLALYRAKRQGKNNYCLYTDELGQHAAQRMRTEQALRQALVNGEFVMHYQPKLDLGERCVDSAEALLRWNGERGIVMPGEFIEVAEETGLLVQIGEWVVKSACEQIRHWDQEGLPPIRVAVNLSLRQLQEDSLVATVERTLREYKVPASRLEFEITESVAMHNVERAVEALNELHASGVHLSMDHFGSGNSSLRHLQRLPLDSLKIDRAFVHELTTSKRGLALVHAIIVMGKSLGMDIIAEGVETAGQLRSLQTEGCDHVQGYLVSEPLPGGEMLHLMQNQGELVRRLLAA